MKHVLLLITTTLAMAFLAIAPASAQQSRTLKSEMEVIHKSLDVNFVYDSAIEINVPYSGKPMKDVIKGGRTDGRTSVMSDADRASLELCLKTLFADTGIEYEIMKKYIVLTKSNSKKKPNDYTIFIEEQQDSIEYSIITAYIDRRHNSTQTGLKEIDGTRFKKGFAVLSSPDLIKEIQNLPGVSGGTELLSGMYVHGGEGYDNLFLLDGVPLYQVSHLAGLISSFNTEMVENVDFYKSGFPARYGSKLSSVVDITTRTGNMNEYAGSFNIGLLNGGLQFEGPIVPGKTSFNVGLRRSWFDVLTVPAFAIVNMRHPYGNEVRMRYAMTDINASLTHLFNKNSILSLNVYMGSDRIRYGVEESIVKYWEGVRHTAKIGNDLDINWGNILTSLNWKRMFSDDLHLDAKLYYTRTNTDVGITNEDWEMGVYEYNVSEYHVSETNHSKLHDIALKADIDWIPSEFHHLRGGLSAIYHTFRPYRDVSVVSKETGVDDIVEGDSFNIGYESPELSAYAEDEISITNWFKANVGLRYVAFGTDDGLKHSLEPRAALRFQLCPSTAIKMSYTEMSQFMHLIHAHYLDVPMSTWMPSTSNVPPMRSRQFAAGIYSDLPHNIVFSIEGYYKTMDNINEYCGIDSIYPDLSLWEYELNRGKGRSYGTEVELGWKSAKTEVSACYTLSWTERFFEGIWYDWYQARNDNRHKLTLNATHRFSKRFDMYAAWNFRSGNRMTVPTQIVGDRLYFTEPYNYQLPAYHRLDVGFNFRKTTKRGNEGIWNLSIYNAYCRMNPMFTMYDSYMEDGSRINKLKVLCAIPIIPSFSYTLRF